MKRAMVGLLCFAAAGCSDSNAPDLEPVSYQAVGSGKVMFMRIGDNGRYNAVYLLDMDNQQTTTVLGNYTVLYSPAISPDGDAIALLSPADCGYNITVTDLVGRVTQSRPDFGCNMEGPPSWTPTESGVVFEAGNPGQPNWAIYQLALGSSDAAPLRPLHTDPTDPASLRCPALLRSLENGAVAVSGTGGIAYACAGGIYGALNAADSIKPIVSFSSTLSAPAWSPDGGSLAFLAAPRNARDEFTTVLVDIYTFATRQLRTLANVPASGAALWNTGNSLSVCWAAQGKRLVFNAFDTGLSDTTAITGGIWVINTDGSGQTRLTHAAGAFDHSVSCSQ